MTAPHLCHFCDADTPPSPGGLCRDCPHRAQVTGEWAEPRTPVRDWFKARGRRA